MEFLRMKMAVILLCLVAVPLCSGGRTLTENGFDVSGQKNSAFDGKLKILVGDDLQLSCEESKPAGEMISSATGDMSEMIFRVKENRTRDVGEGEKYVYNVLPKGPVAPSGPSPIHNGIVVEQRLSKSKHSPAVGHMQVSVNKRILRSTPSPGAGH